MKRRSFIRNSSAVTLPLMLNGLPITAFGHSPLSSPFDQENDKVLVLIQLNGGNDGLQTIIPWDHYDLLANVRSNIIIPSNDILSINDQTGFHPSMGGARSLFDEGKMSILHDVGYPDQNRSHFRSTDIWTTGSPANEIWTTGWLGRYLENRFPDYPIGYPNAENPDPFAMSIGSTVSETCQGSVSNFSLALIDPLSISPLESGQAGELPDTNYGRELDFLRTSVKQANAYGETITSAAEKGNNISGLYNDEINLHRQLKSIALLISGGLRTKIYIANIGGFDTHANQVANGQTTTGVHSELLAILSDAVMAFQDDLQSLGLGERVLTMTFSEFGRRIRSNDSLGTDHGTAAPIMLFGNCLEAGIHGHSPALPDQPTGFDGVPMQFDFRNVYGTVLTDWFGADEEEVRSLLHGDFNRIPFLKDCDAITADEDITTEPEISLYPNPFDQQITIDINTPESEASLRLFNALGSLIDHRQSTDFSGNSHRVVLDGSNLAAGNYFVNISTKGFQRTLPIVKI